MTPYEIREVCITSAKKYYDYLLHNDKGLDIIPVRGIRRRSDEQFILRLEKKIYDLDYVYIKFRDTAVSNKRYKFIEYDSESNQLLVSANGDFRETLQNATQNDINDLCIISDLKYLVKRVEDWYELNGSLLAFDRDPSEYNIDSRLPSLNASDEQIQALKTIFHEGISYIWGAPGTGKTRHVLARALLNYTGNNCKVLVVAPTNNALEQSLYGIIDVLKNENIPKEKILRLGTPSLEFAQKNPECCVEQGVQKRIKELELTIEQYKDKLDAMAGMKNYTLIKHDLIPMVTELNELYAEYENILERYKITSGNKAKYEQKIKDIAEMPKEQSNKTKGFLFSFKKRIKKESDQNNIGMNPELTSNTEQDDKQQEVLEDYTKKLDKFDKDIRNVLYKTAKKRQRIETIIENDHFGKIRAALNGKDTTEKECINNTLVILNSLMMEEEKPYREKARFLTEDDTLEALEEGYKRAQVELGMLKNNTIGKRISNANVIAATIDCYISNFTFSNEDTRAYGADVDIKHIFLDEAAYCCMIKACTLFVPKCPITFLGDHMQLPPVCEMNDSDLKDEEENKEVALWAQSSIAIESMFFDTIDNIYKAYTQNKQIMFDQIVKSNLTTTFRFGSALSSVLDRYVYKNGFRSAGKRNTEIILYHVQCNYGDHIRKNIAEAEAIANIISYKKNQKDDFAILTPYKKQVALIKKRTRTVYGKQRVMTVHSSQGREWDTVILSVVDTAKRWFTDSSNTAAKGLTVINTAVSRAKKRLIIVCDARYWINEKNQLIGSLINIADKKIKYKN